MPQIKKKNAPGQGRKPPVVPYVKVTMMIPAPAVEALDAWAASLGISRGHTVAKLVGGEV